MPDGGKARALAAFPELRAIERPLEIYAMLLRRWQKTVNLVAASTIDDLWWRHFADSAQLARVKSGADAGVDTRITRVDLGSGAGFPGLVLAMLTHGSAKSSSTVLVESDTRKAAFLREVSRETGVKVDVAVERVEDYIPKTKPPPLVMSRAFMPPEQQVRLIRPWLETGTVAALLVGSPLEPSTDDLCAKSVPSRTGPGFVVTLCRRESERH